MNKELKMPKLPIALAAALAFLAIGAVENAKARPLDIGGSHTCRPTPTNTTFVTATPSMDTTTRTVSAHPPLILGTSSASPRHEFSFRRQ